VDFAELMQGGSIAVEGLQVNAVLNGIVAAVIEDRFPYGNAILVESPMESLEQAWKAALEIPEPAPTPVIQVALTCPEPKHNQEWESGERSLYLLYAHLKEPVALQPGESVICGQMLGSIGTSGNALNPHLHLEVRVGPAGAKFSSMAHYDSRATQEEMSNYCTWRVSGYFLLLDPMSLLRTK
jgi:murein DD-endopeptidase MepM/ murein hydrolase activator NlpD